MPPTAYGGIELVVHLLAEELVARGVEVTLIASGDSETSADLVHVYETAPSDRIGESIWELGHVLLALERAGEFDVIHDHSGPLGLALLGQSATPVIHTVHGPLNDGVGDLYERICAAVDGVWLTSLSFNQRLPHPDLPWLANVPNAIDVGRYPLWTGAREDYLLFLGRMSAEKGAHRAIEVARSAGLPLRIAAKCREPAERAYFEELVAPHLGGGIEYLGEVGFDEKIALLSRAAVTLVPIDWEEPFGLVMIESGACGTPVVATRRGSVPEVVTEHVTGIVVDSHLDMPAVLGRARDLKPHAIRAEIARRFDVDSMVSGYLDAYETVLEQVITSRRAALLRRRRRVDRGTRDVVAPGAAQRPATADVAGVLE